ncbi:hypothetical protein scyTo_0024811, partial [Scyliorhinus torazame]|nr:hypothetical protein [Scyliorhinus torazame]
MQCDSRRSALLCTVCPCHQAARCRQSCSPCLACWVRRDPSSGHFLHVALADVEKTATPRKLFLKTASLDAMSESLKKCYIYLNQTSRSFAAVIQALDGDLR